MGLEPKQKTMLFFVPLLVLLSSCNYTRTKIDGSKPLEGESKFQTIQRNILIPKCVSCHGGSSTSQDVDFSSFERVVRDPIVIPFQPEKSKLFTSVKSRWMPKSGSPLSDGEIELIYQWILEGAAEVELPVQTNPNPTPTPTQTPNPSPIPPLKPEPKFSWLFTNFFSRSIGGNQSCLECHSGPKPKGSVDLSSYQKLMDSEGIMSKPIVPESPEESGVYDQLIRQKMPPFPLKPSQEEVKAVYEWIQNGAKNN